MSADEMFYTVSGKFLLPELGIEIGHGRLVGELGLLAPENKRTATLECLEDGDVLTLNYDKVRELYFQNPQFGFYFLKLTSERLLQNIARLEARLESKQTATAAASWPRADASCSRHYRSDWRGSAPSDAKSRGRLAAGNSRLAARGGRRARAGKGARHAREPRRDVEISIGGSARRALRRHRRGPAAERISHGRRSRDRARADFRSAQRRSIAGKLGSRRARAQDRRAHPGAERRAHRARCRARGGRRHDPLGDDGDAEAARGARRRALSRRAQTFRSRA